MGATSKFCIVTSSGYSAIPASFGVPILHTNQLPIALCSNVIFKIYIYPKLSLKIKKNYLSETYISNYITLTDDNSFKKFGLKFYKQSEDEILHATKEMFKIVFKNKNYDEENNEIKKQISNNFKKFNLHL